MNPLMLYPFLDEEKLLRTLVPVALAGLLPLFDFYLLLRFGYLIGTYLTLFLICTGSLAGIALSVSVLIKQQQKIRNSQKEGDFSLSGYNGFMGTLLICYLWILPGFTGKIVGAILFLPIIRIKLGQRLSRLLGIDWHTFYEYIKLYQPDK